MTRLPTVSLEMSTESDMSTTEEQEGESGGKVD